MIRVLIVDDEPPSRRKVRRFLELDPEIGEIQEAGSGEEAVDALRVFAPDLVFLDVQMPGIDGFAALDSIAEPRKFHVVFLTAHQQHALRAFQAEALDYLLKPVDPERFERALERAKEQIALRREPVPVLAATPLPPRFLKRLVVQKSGREIFLPVERLDWAGAERNYVNLHAGEDTYTVRGTLESLVQQLDPDQFVRINRSELVNLDRVKEMHPWFHGERRMVLQNGRELVWTRRFRAASSRHSAASSQDG
jgi:two-component system, LytTR family, response regulator